MAGISETETVIKKIIPYLQRRGYDLAKDMAFEYPAKVGSAERQGFIDVLITCDRPKPVFLLEAKRDGRKITAQHRKQAVDYGKSLGCLLVAVTNGQQFELLNVTTAKPLAVQGTSLNWIPSRSDLLSHVLPQLKKEKKSNTLILPSDRSLPFRPGLPLSKLNHLISQCHNTIRKIEKDEEHAFADFSKLLFLKLLEEKWDSEGEKPLYSYTFHELAAKNTKEADQVRIAIVAMIEKIKEKTKFGDVLEDPIRLKQDATYLKIVKRLSRVSFSDSDLDSKGAAFEYFVRATLRGKKLGQYFTPRPLVRLMLHMGRWRQIVASIRAGKKFKVLDPACGTGGFLVLAMKLCIADVETALKNKEIHKKDAEEFIESLKQEVFFGVDANEGVACSAKMNMIVAGDGQNNIRHMDALRKDILEKITHDQLLVPPYTDAKGKKCNDGKAHLILSNPPFGTSESESLPQADINSYAVKSTKGQSLFIQRMIEVVDPECRIVTVIDEGVLNNYGDQELRRHMLTTCRVEWIVALPEETFKPNKINVKSSFIVLQKRTSEDVDLKDNYPIGFVRVESLGYDGSGEDLRGFELPRLIKELENLNVESLSETDLTKGYSWQAFKIQSSQIFSGTTNRLDFRYWDPSVRVLMQNLDTSGCLIKAINQIQTRRGNSPDAAEYVSEIDGFALVVKAGSNITKTGEVLATGDYIEEALFKEYEEQGRILEDGDILVASTGDGTLGKCGVFRLKKPDGTRLPAIADGHVTVIRVEQGTVYPEYLCDYMRKGFGASQIGRLYTGSTGLIEITPEDIDRVVCPPFPSMQEQKSLSRGLRDAEKEFETESTNAALKLKAKESLFAKASVDALTAVKSS